MDGTQLQLADGGRAWVVDCLDDHARFLLAAVACTTPTGKAAWCSTASDRPTTRSGPTRDRDATSAERYLPSGATDALYACCRAAIMELQEFEDQADLRIKFASMKGQRPLSDAGPEYDGLFRDKDGRPAEWLPVGWQVGDTAMVETLFEHTRQAWRVHSDVGDIAAVEHETGIEILVAIGIGLSVNAITGFTTSAWREWRRRREQTREWREGLPQGPSEDRLVIERTVELPDGTRTHHKSTVPAQLVTRELIERLVGTAVQTGGSANG